MVHKSAEYDRNIMVPAYKEECMAKITAHKYLLDMFKRPSSPKAYGRMSDGCLVSGDISRTVASTKISLHASLPHEEAFSVRAPGNIRVDSAPSLSYEFLPKDCEYPRMIPPPPPPQLTI